MCVCVGFCADLVVPVLLQEVSGHVAGQDVPQHVLVVFPQLLHLVDLLFGLDAPQEVEPGRVLQLKTEGTQTQQIKSVFFKVILNLINYIYVTFLGLVIAGKVQILGSLPEHRRKMTPR